MWVRAYHTTAVETPNLERAYSTLHSTLIIIMMQPRLLILGDAHPPIRGLGSKLPPTRVKDRPSPQKGTADNWLRNNLTLLLHRQGPALTETKAVRGPTFIVPLLLIHLYLPDSWSFLSSNHRNYLPLLLTFSSLSSFSDRARSEYLVFADNPFRLLPAFFRL